ncbi:MAG: hypothetical protein C0503_12120 [Gemmatimonas sp.]|nr:hypothetical protein [Gemmatimonas sp.]
MEQLQQKHTLYRCERLMDETTIFVPRELRADWPDVASSWRRQYPMLFDEHDLRLARSQPRNHFAEWVSAIHFFQTLNLRSLVEKYAFDKHEAKAEKMQRILDEPSRARLANICRRHRCQPPDLLLYDDADALVAFAEVKGPNDRMRPKQSNMITAVKRAFAVPVLTVRVRFVAG